MTEVATQTCLVLTWGGEETSQQLECCLAKLLVLLHGGVGGPGLPPLDLPLPLHEPPEQSGGPDPDTVL